jgi:hypothetical protein
MRRAWGLAFGESCFETYAFVRNCARLALAASSALVLLYWEIRRTWSARREGSGANIVDRLARNPRRSFRDAAIVKQLVSKLRWGLVVRPPFPSTGFERSPTYAMICSLTNAAGRRWTKALLISMFTPAHLKSQIVISNAQALDLATIRGRIRMGCKD